MKKSYVEFTITGPNTERKIIVNAVRLEPEGKEDGTCQVLWKVEPQPPNDEDISKRSTEEDLMYFLLNSMIKGMSK